MAAKLLIVGLDAGTFDILDPLVANGDMPNLARLFAEGARAELESTFPPTTAPAWPSLVTGLGPGKLGLFGLLNKRPGTQYDFAIAQNSFDARSLWRHASDAGVRAVACGVPATFPPVPSANAVVVTGMLTPNGHVRTAPAELNASLAAEGLLIDWEELRSLEQSVELPDDEARLALHLMRTLEWEIFVTVFRASDGIFHTHPDASDAHREIFRRIDRHIGAMRDAAGDGANTFVVSDHGMTRLAEVVHLNALFVREGLLARRDVAETLDERAARFVDRVKASPFFDNPIVKNPIARRAAEALRQRRAARTLDFGREGRRQPRLSEALVEWSKTTCFFVDLGYGSGVYLNLAGREPLGIVDPRDYDATRERVRALLEREADVAATPREEVYTGPFVDRAPDLLVATKREQVGLSGRLLDTPVRTRVDVPYFHHTSRGIVAASGPDVRAGARFEPFEIVDVLPTVLHLAGIPVPSDVDGVVRRELFRDESRATREPLYADATPLDDPDGIDPYDDDAIREKLRGLGYMH